MPQPGNPQALNRYSYVLNNPLKYIDPSGHDIMLVGGLGSTDWNDPSGWKDWIMKYKGWTEREWLEQFYTPWTAKGVTDADKQKIMEQTGIHIFNWNKVTGGSANKDNVTEAGQELAAQMQGMADITVIGHSKGGRVLATYMAKYGNTNPALKNAVFIEAATNAPVFEWVFNRAGDPQQHLDATKLLPGISVVTITDPWDYLVAGLVYLGGPIPGAMNLRIKPTRDGGYPMFYHGMKGHMAGQVLHYYLDTTMDTNALTIRAFPD